MTMACAPKWWRPRTSQPARIVKVMCATLDHAVVALGA
jgi:hypothetical protein